MWDTKKNQVEENYRKTLIGDAYKGTRDKSKNDDIYSGVETLENLALHLGIKNFYPGSLEADDAISYLSKNLTGKITIVSADKDLFQLINENVVVYQPMEKKVYKADEFTIRFGVSPSDYVLYKSFTGDLSDNISGIKGIGKVKGIKLVNAYKKKQNGEEIDQPINKILEENKELIETNIKLVDLSKSYKLLKEEEPWYAKQLENSEKTVNISNFINHAISVGIIEESNRKFEYSKWNNVFGGKTSLTELLSILNK